jgi:predicted transcriptional regulator
MLRCSYGNVRVFRQFYSPLPVPRVRHRPAPVRGILPAGAESIVRQYCCKGPSVDTSCDLIELTVSLVASFVSHNAVTAAELPGLIRNTYTTLSELTASHTGSQIRRVPAVPIDKSVTRDYIICLDDGRRLKTLRRYIKRKYSLTPGQYRERWGLPDDYPMVAPGYSELRSALAMRFAKRSRKG